jgi:D-alanyl-lipoteichoic acid acyltransferase DltB (MBOAT superfamily)
LWKGLITPYLTGWVYSLATMATMLLCGFWHGAAWTFILWGGAHGIAVEARLFIGWRPKWWPAVTSHRLLGAVGLAVLLVASILFRGSGSGFVYFMF